MGKFERFMSKIELKKSSKDVWRLYWASGYNRLERRIGWILLSIGAMIILALEAIKWWRVSFKIPLLLFDHHAECL